MLILFKTTKAELLCGQAGAEAHVEKLAAKDIEAMTPIELMCHKMQLDLARSRKRRYDEAIQEWEMLITELPVAEERLAFDESCGADPIDLSCRADEIRKLKAWLAAG